MASTSSKDSSLFESAAAEEASIAGFASVAEYYEQVDKAAEYIRGKLEPADVALVLGSGLKTFTEELSSRKDLSFADIPGMPRPTVAGHPGTFSWGLIGETRVYCLAGRKHAYEGVSLELVCFGVQLVKRLGCRVFVATNAAGGALPGMQPGAFMAITDHVNLVHRSPFAQLVQHPQHYAGPRHPVLRRVYSPELLAQARSAAEHQQVKLWEGTYAWYCGPSYETCAEVRAGQRLGYGTFGMSTAPETSLAAALGMHVVAFSLATNMAAGLSDEHLTHEQVQVVAAEATPRFTAFMKRLLSELRIPEQPYSACAPATDADITDADVTNADAAHASPAPVTALPPLQPLTVGATALSTARAAVLAAFGSAAPEGRPAVCVRCCAPAADPQLSAVSARVSLASLAPSLVVSPAFRSGELLVAELAGVKVVVVCPGAPEAFTVQESRFVALLLRSLGVSRLVLEVEVTSLQEDRFAVGTHAFAADCLDRTTCTPALPASAIETLGRDQLWTDVAPLSEALRDSTKPQASLWFDMGPEFPTNAELALPRAAGCELVAHCNGALVYQSASAGLPVAVVAVVTRVVSEPYSAPASCASTSVAELSSLSVSALTASADCASAALLSEAALARLDGSGGELQAGFDLVRPVSQGSPAQLEEAAALLRKAAAPDDAQWSAALLVDAQLAPALVGAESGAKRLAQYSELPGFSEVSQGGAVYCVPLCAGSAARLLVFVGCAYLSRGDHNAALSLVSRLTGVLGLRKLVLLQQAASVQPQPQQEKEAAESEKTSALRLAVVRDHVNLSGRNTLYGKNQWGLRFFDAGKCYHEGLCSAALSALGQSAEDGVQLAQVVGPLYRSDALARLCAHSGCDLVSTSLVQEALVGHHMSLDVLGLVVVRSSVTGGSESPVAVLSEKQAAPLRASLGKVLQVVAQQS